jgi:hypothetical protein
MVLAVPTRRRLVAALIVVALAAAAAPAAAHDGPPWHAHKGNGHGHGKHDDQDDDGPRASTTTPGTTTAPATGGAPAATAPAAPTPAPVLEAVAPAPAPLPTAPAPAPALGRSVALAAVSGTVLVRTPGGAPVPLAAGAAAATLPTGTRVDTRSGAVDLTSAKDAQGTTQTGRFSGGVFEVRQQAGRKGLTEIVLVGGHWGACRTRAHRAPTAVAARRRKPIRHLWGSDDHGRFQTRGGGSVATVRGTRWLTEDFCDGTRTTVAEGAVAVRSRATGRTVLVRAGHRRFVAR